MSGWEAFRLSAHGEKFTSVHSSERGVHKGAQVEEWSNTIVSMLRAAAGEEKHEKWGQRQV